MIPAPIPDNEAERAASLERMNLLSTPREADLDCVTRTARRMFGTEIALISLIDRERQWFKSRIGIDVAESPRETSFCGHAIMDEQAFVIPDASADERFHDNPYVTGPLHLRFYAAQPLTNADGFRIGALCVISREPRTFSEDERQALQDLGRLVEIVLSSRRMGEAQAELVNSLAAANRDKLIDPLTGLWNRGGFDEMFRREIARAVREKAPLAVIMVDIDHFKKINDSFGHAKGDEAIKMVASLLLDSCRATDVVARHGGEEFAVIAPGIEPAMLPAFGDKILRRFHAKARLRTPQGPYPFTVSLGLTCAHPKKETKALGPALLKLADQALYAAKGAGRDRFHIAEPPDGHGADAARE